MDRITKGAWGRGAVGGERQKQTSELGWAERKKVPRRRARGACAPGGILSTRHRSELDHDALRVFNPLALYLRGGALAKPRTDVAAAARGSRRQQLESSSAGQWPQNADGRRRWHTLLGQKAAGIAPNSGSRARVSEPSCGGDTRSPGRARESAEPVGFKSLWSKGERVLFIERHRRGHLQFQARGSR